MNVGTFNNNPLENTIPLENTVSPWLLPFTCRLQRCHCNARFKPDIIYVKGLPYQANPSTTFKNNLKIQFIEFTYCNDRFSLETITKKIEKYQPLIDNITNRWNVELVIVITVGARAPIHIPFMKILEEKFKISLKTIRQIFSFFKNVIKSIKNSLKYIQLNHLRQIEFKSSKISIKKLFVHEIKYTPKLKKDWLQALYESF